MSKLGVAAATMGVGGTGAAGTYTAYSLGAFGGGGGASNKHSPGRSSMASTSADFQQTNRKGRCFSSNQGTSGIFDKWATNGTVGEAKDSLTTVSQQSDVQWDSTSNGSVQGCLDWQWEIKNNRWEESSFGFVWVVAKGDKAFSVYLTAKGTSEKKFEIDGVAHAFKRESEGWKTTHKLDVQKKELSGDDIKAKFPQNDKNLSAFKTWVGIGNNYWGFLDDGGTGLSTGEVRENNYNHPFKATNGDKDIGSWSPNLKEWWNHFFGEDKWNMSELVKDIKGEWGPHVGSR